MSGVKREWLAGESIALDRSLLRELNGDYETAAVITAVTRQPDATEEQLQAATLLEPWRLARALRRARKAGYLR